MLFLVITACSSPEEDGEEQSPDENPQVQNQAPVAGNQTIFVNQESVIEIKAQGLDLDGDRLELVIDQEPSNGSYSVFGSTISYRPRNGFSGQDIMKIKFSDGEAFSNVATITINVSSVFVNSPPILLTPAFNLQEDVQTLLQLQVLDIDRDDISFTIISPPQNGQLIGSFPNIEYLGNLNFDGEDAFTVRISDGIDSIDALIEIDVLSINDAPTFSNTSFNIQEDIQTELDIQVQDIDSETLTYEVISGPTKGSLIGVIPNLEYKPNTDSIGLDTFTISVSDGVNTVSQEISVLIEEINDPPVAQSFSLTINEDTERTLPLAGTDAENQPLTFLISRTPNNSQIIFRDGNWVLVPNQNFFGQIVFGYKVSDGEKLSEEVLITVDITSVNDVPTAEDIVVNTEKNEVKIFTLSYQDVDSSNLTIEILETTRGQAQIQGNQIVYTPEVDFIGYDGFTYRVRDDLGAVSAVRYVDLTVVDDEAGRRWLSGNLPVQIRIPMEIDSGLLSAIMNVKEKWNAAVGMTVLVINQTGVNQEYDEIYDSLDDYVYSIVFQYNNWFVDRDSTLAVTVSQTIGSNYLVNTDILFNFFGYPFSTLTPVPNASVDFESVLLHEMGHLLGLPHISREDDPASIMNPTFSFGEEKRGLSIYDHQSIRKKYSEAPLSELPGDTNLNYMGMEVQTSDHECSHINEELN